MGQLAVGTLKGLCKGILAVSSGLWNYVPRRVKRCNLPMLPRPVFLTKKTRNKNMALTERSRWFVPNTRKTGLVGPGEGRGDWRADKKR